MSFVVVKLVVVAAAAADDDAADAASGDDGGSGSTDVFGPQKFGCFSPWFHSNNSHYSCGNACKQKLGYFSSQVSGSYSNKAWAITKDD